MNIATLKRKKLEVEQRVARRQRELVSYMQRQIQNNQRDLEILKRLRKHASELRNERDNTRTDQRAT